MTTRTSIMLSLLATPIGIQFDAPTEHDGVPCVFGGNVDVWVMLLGPAEALHTVMLSIALSSPLARGVASNALVAPLFEAIWPGDAPLMGWYIRSCLTLLQPRQALVELTYDARPVRLVYDRATARFNVTIGLSDDG